MDKLTINTTKKEQVIDITNEINEIIVKQKVKEGVCVLFLTHTTAALTTADLDPGTDQDYLDAFEKIIPKLNYNHPHNPSHAPDHIISTLIGTSLTVPIKDGKLVLGIWQRVVLLEFSGPRSRELTVSILS